VIIEYTRLAHFLAQLEAGRTGTAFIFDRGGELIAAPDKTADELHPAHCTFGDRRTTRARSRGTPTCGDLCVGPGTASSVSTGRAIESFQGHR